MPKAAQAFRTIAEVADELGVQKHVLRFWESKFPQIKPMKRGGGRRYYRPEDLELLRGIQRLLHGDAYTIKGVQKILKQHGVEFVKAQGQAATTNAPEAVPAVRRRRAATPKTPEPSTKAAAGERTAVGNSGGALGPRETTQALRSALKELESAQRVLEGTRKKPSAREAATPAPSARARKASGKR